MRSRAFPDEEGTESAVSANRRLVRAGSRAFPDEEGTESPSYILDQIPLSQSKLDDCTFLGKAFCAQSVTSLFGAAPRVLDLARSSAGAPRVRDLGTWEKTPELGLKKEQLEVRVRRRLLLGYSR